MDLRESMWDSTKVLCEGLHVQLAAKLFCHETFIMYGILQIPLETFSQVR